MIEEEADDEIKDAGLIAAGSTSLSVLDAGPAAEGGFVGDRDKQNGQL